MTSAAASSRTGTVIWLLVRLAIRIFYRVQRIGAPLPDGPVLLVANHPNSLLDPALVQATAGRPIRFLAKSTLFRGHFLSPLIRRSGAIPVYRRIDPATDMSRNEEMFAEVEAALAQAAVVCLFPEGISHSTGRLEQLRTGAARIALASMANGVRVAIAPIGLNFDRLSVFRSRATVVFGNRFGCDDLASTYEQDPQAAIRTLTGRIGAHLRGLMIEANPRADLRLVERIDRLYSAARGVSTEAVDRVRRWRVIAASIDRLREQDPAQYQAILARVQEYDACLIRFGLRDRDVGQEIPARMVVRFAVREGALAAMLGPLAVAGLVLFAAPYWLTGWISRRAPDLESRATWQVVGGILIYGAWIGALGAIAGVTYGTSSAVAVLVLLPLTAGGGVLAFERESAVLRTVRSFLALRQIPLRARVRLRHQRSEIATVLEHVREWLERGEQGESSEWDDRKAAW